MVNPPSVRLSVRFSSFYFHSKGNKLHQKAPGGTKRKQTRGKTRSFNLPPLQYSFSHNICQWSGVFYSYSLRVAAPSLSPFFLCRGEGAATRRLLLLIPGL